MPGLEPNVLRIPPRNFVHVLDNNSNIEYLEVGPRTLVLEAHEKLVVGPLAMITVPPGHYCAIKDPLKGKYEKGKPIELLLGTYTIRLPGEPFPLYPGESLRDAPDYHRGKTPDCKAALKKLPVVGPNCALLLKAELDVEDEEGERRQAGDQWQVEGPRTYIPVPGVSITRHVFPVVVGMRQVLRLRALENLTDKDGNDRVTGEEWLVTRTGSYLPGTFEEIMGLEEVQTLTLDSGLYLRATQTVRDARGKERVAGEEWMVTGEDTETYTPQIGVEVSKNIKRTVLGRSEYCVVVDPAGKDGKPQLGKRELRTGVSSFFLQPGESLEQGIKKAYILERDEAVVIEAREEMHASLRDIVDDALGDGSRTRKPGDRWMVHGPVEYIPTIDVKVVDKRKSISLAENEGIYVQNTQTGEVRSEMGPQSYLLQTFERLWEKHLPDQVEEILRRGGGIGDEDVRKVAYFEQSIDMAYVKGRDKTRVVSYRCPGNTAVQVNNYKEKTARSVFGPDLVLLGPHEEFNVLALSAGKPKRPHALKTFCLMLGPDFITDILTVETSDHARLSVRLSFNNHFEYERGNPKSEAKIFAVPDFIGYSCNQIGSRIRAMVAQTTFDEFHKHSANIIRTAVFGVNSEGRIRDELIFENNNLKITNVDVQSIEPVDMKMRDSLMRSVQMAIEIATSSTEAAAKHEADRVEQVSRGELERQNLLNDMEAEKERCLLAELQAQSAAVESTGQAKAEAQAQAERILIECHSQIETARLEAEAKDIEHQSELDAQTEMRSALVNYQREQYQLEVEKSRQLANIEVKKLAETIDSIGRDTITAIATAGPEMQVRLLGSLGLEATIITDGNSPINLFNTAQGLVAGASKK